MTDAKKKNTNGDYIVDALIRMHPTKEWVGPYAVVMLLATLLWLLTMPDWSHGGLFRWILSLPLYWLLTTVTFVVARNVR